MANAELVVLQLTDGRDFNALVSAAENGVKVATALGNFTLQRESLRAVCEKLLTLCNHPPNDVGI